MKEPTIGYTVEFEIDEDGKGAFEKTGAQISRLVEETEPGTLMYEWFVSEDGETARLCEWFTDSEGALDHLEGKALNELLPTLLETSEITNIEVFGTPSEELAEALSNFPVSGPYRHTDGFTR